MVSLADIGPLSKKVEIRNSEFEVRGVNVLEIFRLLEEFPGLKSVIAQRSVSGDLALAIIQGIPAAIGSIIACACGEGDNPKAAIAAQALTVGEQAELLEAIADMTFPKGVRSFVASLERLIAQASGGRGWAADTNSPAPSKNASEQDTQSNESGDTAPANSQDGPKLSTEKQPAETST